MTAELNHFLWGALAMASMVAAAFFYRFWHASSDRLFAFFAAAFLLFAADWTGAALLPNIHRVWVLVLRLAAFMLIIVAVIDKNRRLGR